MPAILNPVFRFALKVLLSLLATLFAVCVLTVALGIIALSLLKSLLTWRKPALVEMFSQFRRFRSQAVWPSTPAGGAYGKRKPGEVVDVEVREIRRDKHLP